MRWSRSLGLVAVTLALSAAAVPAQETAPDFEREVLPILERRCFRCHRAASTDTAGKVQKPKGGLRLDGRAHFLRGGDGGAVLVPGVLDESEVYLRVSLPADDPDYMPSKGEGMTAEELQVFRRWIESGAEFGAWEGATDGRAAPEPVPTADAALPTPSRVKLYQDLAEGVSPPAQALVDRLERLGAQVRPILAADDLRLLRVAFPSGARSLGRDEIQALAGVRAHVAELVLARTTFDESALLAELARMPRLVRVDLRETGIRGAALDRLARLEHLRSLNLFGCRELDDDAIDALASLTRLEQLHVWQTGISKPGMSRLRKTLSGTRVVGAPVLPRPAPADESPRRR